MLNLVSEKMNVSFDNTEIAFSSKTDKELKWAHKLFQLIGNNFLVKVGSWGSSLALKIGLPIKGIVKKTIFAQFCGGETIEECSSTITHLGNYNVGTILDYSVEGKTTNKEFDQTCEELLNVIRKANGDENVPFSVFKVSGLGSFSVLKKKIINQKEDDDFAKILDRVDRLCQASVNANTPIFIDAEESWIQNTIDWIAEMMMEKYNKKSIIVYNTAQLYRHDRLNYIKELHKRAQDKQYNIGLKIVRGAYMEKERERAKEKGYPSPINPTKEATDKLYDEALAYCIENIDTIAICAGTHNEQSSLYLAELIEKKGLNKSHPNLYFAQLLGMSDHISFNLSDANFNVAKYVPYGPIKEVLPYLIRRAEENTSVAGQTSRELKLISKEISRRKKI